MAGIDNAIYDKLIKKKWYQQEFLASGTFVALIDGIYFITGCGAGSGGVYSPAGNVAGGSGGAGCFKYPVYLYKGESVVITIGAGGIGSSTGTRNSGGTTSFGSYIILPGGLAGTAAASQGGLAGTNQAVTGYDSRPVGFLFCGASSATVSVGQDNSSFPPGSLVTGGAGGFFGAGGNGSASANGGDAPANSGAGGGSTSASTFSGGNGGSGRLIVQWQG